MAAMLAAASFSSCESLFDGLEGDLTKMTGDDMASSEAGIEMLLAEVYSYIPMNEFGYEDQYTMNATDSHGGDYGFASNPYYGMYGLHDFWDWAAIRSINSFIDVVNNAVERGVIDTEARDRYVAEARFVRAYCYFVMVRSYGGVPIITEVLDKYYDGAGNEQLFAFAERATEKETWDFVLSELDAAAAALGESPASEFRASRYSALGLKARAALYAASVSKYWDNQGAIDSKYKAVASKKTYMEESYASEYYRQCIKACEDIIISGRFSLYGANPGSVEEAVQNLGDMFRTKQDCEYLFGRSLNDGVTSSGSNYDVYNSPAQTVSGNNSCGKYSVTIDFVDKFDYYTGELKVVQEIPYSDGPRAKVKCYGADDVREGVAILWKENVDVSITGNSTNPTRFQHPVAGTYKKERVLAGKPYFSVASGGGTGRTLHPDNMAAGPASYGMTDTLGRMHSDAQFAGSSSVPAHVEMMGFLGMGNNPMVGATVAVAVTVDMALNKK